MRAKVDDSKGKELRIMQISHELGYSLTVTDPGHALTAEQRDKFLNSLADAALKRIADGKGTDSKRSDPKSLKIGESDSKWLQITYKDAEGVARTCTVFVVYGDKFTVGAVGEFRDEDKR